MYLQSADRNSLIKFLSCILCSYFKRKKDDRRETHFNITKLTVIIHIIVNNFYLLIMFYTISLKTEKSEKMRIIITLLLLLFAFYTRCQVVSPGKVFKGNIVLTTQLIDSLTQGINEKDSIQIVKLRDHIIDQIKAFEPYYIAEAENTLSSYKVQIEELEQQVEVIQNELIRKREENELLRGYFNKEVVSIVDSYIADKDLSEQKLRYIENQLDKTESCIAEYAISNNDLQNAISRYRDSLNYVVGSFESLQEKYNNVFTSVKMGLSIGFNGFFNNQLEYIVGEDGKLKERGNRRGASGLVSAVISIKLDSLAKHSVIINIPLQDFTSLQNQAIGIFNERLAVGLGYGRKISQISPNLLATISFNISPYQALNYADIKEKEVDLPVYTRINPVDYGSYTAYTYSVTIGIVYNFSTQR